MHPHSDHPAAQPTYSPDTFRAYAPIVRETLAVLDKDYQGPYGLTLPAKTFDDLQWRELLAQIAIHCISDQGAAVVRSLPLLQHRASVLRRLREVEESTRLLLTDEAPPLRGLSSVIGSIDHVRRGGVLDGEQLLAVASCAKVAGLCKVYFRSREHLAPLLAQLADDLHTMPEVVQAIERAFDPSGQLADHASPDLGSLRRRVANLHGRVRQKIDSYLKDIDFQDHLQDNYYTLREERYVLPIRASDKGSVPGIVHGTSGSGQTIFIEPSALVELNNELRLAQLEVAEEERRILARLSGIVGKVAGSLRANDDLLVYLDVTTAMGHAAVDLQASRPELSSDERLSVRHARHPMLVYKSKASEEPFQVVPNDFEFGAEGEDGTTQRVLVISGPNTGGKTVSLKTLGVFSLMVRAGLLIPAAPGGTVPLFGAIFTDIGDEQSIERDLSTFSGHVANITSFLDQVGERTLVLLDELFAGTDPAQGAALATALLEHLAERGAMVAVTTHLDGVKTLALNASGFVNAAVGFDVQRLAPTYRLSMGLPGSSYAIRIARRLGLKEVILARATDISEGVGQAEIETILRDLEREREALDRKLADAEAARMEARKLRSRFESKLHELRQGKRKAVDKDLAKALKLVEEANDLVRGHIARLQSADAPKTVTHDSLESTRKALADVQASLKDTRDTNRSKSDRAQATESGKRRAPKERELKPGDKVWVAPFKRQGTLLDPVEGSSRVSVQMGSIKASVQTDDLFLTADLARSNASRRAEQVPLDPGATPSSTPPPLHDSDGGERVIAPQNPDNTVDLRGLRSDDAIERLELFLDAAYQQNEPGVYIIHGHGTGALKRAVRTFLPSSRYPTSFRPGERGEGGDGVTVAYLR